MEEILCVTQHFSMVFRGMPRVMGSISRKSMCFCWLKEMIPITAILNHAKKKKDTSISHTTYHPVTPPINSWVATLYFSTEGPDSCPNSLRHHGCFLAYSARSSDSKFPSKFPIRNKMLNNSYFHNKFLPFS